MNRRTTLAVYLALAWTTNTCAADLLVTSNQDSGAGSLRAAIESANSTIEADTIRFQGSMTIGLASTLPAIASTIAIDGSGQNVTISGSNAVRVMQVNTGGNLELRHVTVANGLLPLGDSNPRAGAGIRNLGTLAVRNCTFANNRAEWVGHLGGAIYSDGGSTLDIGKSNFYGNYTAAASGGGVYTRGTSTIGDSTFHQNEGGALLIASGATITVSNSTFSGNLFGILALNVNGPLNLINSSIYGNSRRGLNIVIASINVANTVIAGNGEDCVLSLADVNHTGPNLIGDGSCSPALTGDPKLAPLADNGGPTQTHALLAESPAIDAGNDTICSGSPVNGLDQRGQPRPAGAHCDLGAYEYSALFPFSGFLAPVDGLPTVNTVKAGQAIPVKFSLGGNRGLNIFAAGYPASQPESCSAAATSEVEQVVTAGKSTLAYDQVADVYTFIWATDKQWANSCRQLILKLTDGTTHIASFQFR